MVFWKFALHKINLRLCLQTAGAAGERRDDEARQQHRLSRGREQQQPQQDKAEAFSDLQKYHLQE